MPEKLRERLVALRQYWAGLQQGMRWGILASAALLLAALLVLGLWLSRTSYAVVYAGLNPRQGGDVIAALQKDGIPFRLENNGSIVEVPKALADEVRLKLAEQGLPTQASSTLWNSLEKEKLGTSSFVEQTTYLRALEATLAQEISTLHGVQSAHVQLAIPRHTPFLETMPKPKAAVTVHLLAGVHFSSEEVAGIRHLVAGSVPGLAPKDVTIVNQLGKALSADDNGISDSRVLHLQEMLEKNYRLEVVKLLSPLVGGGKNLRVVVNARVSVSKGQVSSIQYGVGHAVTAEIRSEEKQGSSGNGAIGIPGALSNIPPGGPLAPLVAPTASNASSMSLAEIKALIPRSSKNAQQYHYVLDKSVSYHREAPWRLKHLAVSVLVNSNLKPPPSPQTVAQMQKLVETAFALSPSMASVDVSSLPFYAPSVPMLKWWQRLSWPLIWQSSQWFLMSLLLLFFLRRPLRQYVSLHVEQHEARVVAQKAQEQEKAREQERVRAETAASEGKGAEHILQQISDSTPQLDLSGIGESQLEENMETVRNLIRTDVERALQVVREWLGDFGDEMNG